MPRGERRRTDFVGGGQGGDDGGDGGGDDGEVIEGFGVGAEGEGRIWHLA